MVLGWRRPGRVGRCRIFLTTKSISSHHIFSHARQQRGKLVLLSSVGATRKASNTVCWLKPKPSAREADASGTVSKSDERSGSKRAASYYRESKTTIPAKGEIILLSSVGSSERLLTARSLVRVQQGEPQKGSKSYDLLFLLSLLPVVHLTNIALAILGALVA